MANWLIGDGKGVMMFGSCEIGSEEPSPAVPITIKSRSQYSMGGVSVGARGPGRDLLQFAADVDGEPGVWAAVGEEVTPGRVIHPGESFNVWARIVPPPEDTEPGNVAFQINIDAFVVG